MLKVMSIVKRHFFSMPGAPVCRQDLVDYGSSSAVDSALNKLLIGGIIIRRAWGVYAYPDLEGKVPSAEEVAEAKIGAFLRQRQEPHSRKNDVEPSSGSSIRIKKDKEEDGVLVYGIAGCHSSFNVLPTSDHPGVLVKLVRRAARKMHLEYTPEGRYIKHLWEKGKDNVTVDEVKAKLQSLNRKERERLQSAHRSMTGWISNIFHSIKPPSINGTIQKAAVLQKKYGAYEKLVLVPKFNPMILQLDPV